MGIISLIISIVVLVSCLFLFKDKFLNPVTFFVSLWTFILLLSNFNLYGLTKPCNEAYLLIIIMIVFFFLGGIIYNFLKRKHVIPEKKSDESNCVIKPRIKIIYILLAISLVFSLIDCILVISNLLKDVPMWQIRNWTLEPFGSINPILLRRTFIEEFIRTMIIGPFNSIVPAIAAYYFFSESKNKQYRIFLFCSVLSLLMTTFAGGGGRLGVIGFVCSFVLAFFMRKKSILKNVMEFKKYKKIIFIGLIAGFIIVFIYSFMRNGAGYFIRQTYIYFALPPTLLSLWLPTISVVPHLYGMLTTYGFHGYIFRGFEAIGLNFLVPAAYTNSHHYILQAEKFLNVGSGISNAFVTPIYYFYIDGGYLFVCVASMVFGFIVSILYDRICNGLNVRKFITYKLIMYGVFVSFMRVQTCIPGYIICFLLVYLLFPKKMLGEEVYEQIN